MHRLTPGCGIDDLTLIREAQAGSRSAFTELISLYDRAALRLALHLTGSEPDAQDICQEAFLRAYQNIASFRGECSFYTWIYRIVTNLCLDHLRKRQTHKQQNLTKIDSQGEEHDFLDHFSDGRTSANPEGELLRRELGKRIQLALNLLSPRERLIFELRHFHGLRLRTIGNLLKVREGSIKTSLFRATKKLRKALSSERPRYLLSPGGCCAKLTCRDNLGTV